jgi:DNA-binding MarR family transcriptional regulator
MTPTEARTDHISAIDDIVRQITWQSHKQLLQTLSHPDIDLTLPQMVTLFAIRDARRCRMSELAETTQQSAGTLTGIVDRLIDDHLVGRVRDMEDRRVVQVMLTSLGEQRLARVEAARREDMEQMLRHFKLDQLAHLEQLLRLLLSGLHELINGELAHQQHTNGSNGALSSHLNSLHV